MTWGKARVWIRAHLLGLGRFILWDDVFALPSVRVEAIQRTWCWSVCALQLGWIKMY